MELPESSCRACEKITHRFERVCAREIFGKFRIRHKLPTRRKKERPKTIVGLVATADKSGFRPISINAEDYPTELFLYTYKRANILLGLPSNVDTLDWSVIGINSHSEMLEYEKKHGGAFVTTVKPQPIEFGRLLAKIGHAYAVANLGLDSFSPLAIDVIMGRDTNISHLVGAHPEIEPPVPDAGHLVTLEYRVKPFAKEALLMTQIRLFASTNTPTYHVVVGEVKSAEHVKALFEQMKTAKSIEAEPSDII